MSTTLRPIEQRDVEPLRELLIRDNHDSWNPTHVIEKDGELVGSVSIDGVPMCTAFISNEVQSGITLREVRAGIESVLKTYGDRSYFICVPPSSPVFRFMPVGGYLEFPTTLWYKEI